MMGNAKLLQQMQAQMLKIQKELGEQTVEATAGGGAVKIVITGQQRVQAVTLDATVVDPDDVEMLQDLMVAAFNERRFADVAKFLDDKVNVEMSPYDLGKARITFRQG